MLGKVFGRRETSKAGAVTEHSSATERNHDDDGKTTYLSVPVAGVARIENLTALAEKERRLCDTSLTLRYSRRVIPRLRLFHAPANPVGLRVSQTRELGFLRGAVEVVVRHVQPRGFWIFPAFAFGARAVSVAG